MTCRTSVDITNMVPRVTPRLSAMCRNGYCRHCSGEGRTTVIGGSGNLQVALHKCICLCHQYDGSSVSADNFEPKKTNLLKIKEDGLFRLLLNSETSETSHI